MKAGKFDPKQNSNLRVNDVINNHGFSARKGESLYVQAKLILDTLSAFMVSADDRVTIDHCPKYREDQKKGRVPVSHEYRQVSTMTMTCLHITFRRIKKVEVAWKALCVKSKGSIKMKQEKKDKKRQERV